MTWKCSYCNDEMDEKFRKSHMVLCEIARILFQDQIDKDLEEATDASG